MNTNIPALVFGSLTIAMVPSCVHDPFPPPPLTAEEACEMGYIDYEAQIQPIFTSNCTMPGCHGGRPGDEDFDLTNYFGVLEEVDQEDPLDSDLWERLTDNDPDDRMPRPPSDPLSADQLELIRQWLIQGAKNIDCGRGCDTAGTPGYAAHIDQIISQNCRGCHSGTSPQGGFTLMNATEVGDAIDNRNLLNAIQGLGAGPSMPFNSDLMIQCNIDLILEWDSLGRPQ